MSNSRKHGFTLVEISIVLVIIGLLIGGILAASSMINTTEVQASVRQVSQFDAALNSFNTKFGSLPGDANKIYAGGDNDGKIEDDSGTDGLAAEFSGEVANFWSSLSTTDAIGKYTATVTGSLKNKGDNANIPASKIGNDNTGVIVLHDYYPTGNAASLRDKRIAGVYLIGDVSDVTDSDLSIAPTNIRDGITPITVSSLDAKMDDGNPETGSLIALSRSGNCYTGSSYNTNSKNDDCSIVMSYLRSNNSSAHASTGSSSSSSGGPTCDPLLCEVDNGNGGCDSMCTGGRTCDGNGACICNNGELWNGSNCIPEGDECLNQGGTWDGSSCECDTDPGNMNMMTNCMTWNGSQCVTACAPTESCEPWAGGCFDLDAFSCANNGGSLDGNRQCMCPDNTPVNWSYGGGCYEQVCVNAGGTWDPMDGCVY